MNARRLALICGLLVAIAIFGGALVVLRHRIEASAPELQPLLAKATEKENYAGYVYSDTYGTMEFGEDMGARVGDPMPKILMSPSPPSTPVKSIDIFPRTRLRVNQPSNQILKEIKAMAVKHPEWEKVGGYGNSFKKTLGGKTVLGIYVAEGKRGESAILIRDQLHQIPRWRAWIFSRLHI